MLVIAALMIFTIVQGGGPVVPILLLIAVWSVFVVASSWNRMELMLDRAAHSLHVVKTPILGATESRLLSGDEVEDISIVKSMTWDVYLQRKNGGNWLIDNSDDEEDMRRLAGDVAEALAVPLREAVAEDKEG